MKILVTGTPGVGKSLFTERLMAKLLDAGLHYSVLNVSQLVQNEHLYEEYDDRLDSIVMNDKAVKRRLKEILSDEESNIIIESHTISLIPRKFIDHVFVLRVPSTTVYYDRLAARGYSQTKIEENIDCEIMQVVWDEAVERFESENVTVFISEIESHLEDALLEAIEIIDDLSSL